MIFFSTGLPPLSITWTEITKSGTQNGSSWGEGRGKASWAVSGRSAWMIHVYVFYMRH
jgi:hypothetical protein